MLGFKANLLPGVKSPRHKIELEKTNRYILPDFPNPRYLLSAIVHAIGHMLKVGRQSATVIPCIQMKGLCSQVEKGHLRSVNYRAEIYYKRVNLEVEICAKLEL